ncbi:MULTISPECIES: Sec-independent protein translocase subunit TatA/TatB [Haloferax]|uniref:Sec-independent protein translocase protein TatA n=2 Tax=Haloferax gibbonsii TaxID=35746 RepID=A0A0K1IS26_HALGI|nr:MULTISPECIES: twin-arginine translocase TatA/TatE family subunit [Haloferax]AKU07256.1 preprotein translocase subunit TatA [Haloferax gibbonsii]ELZ77340.1 twin arginine translocation system subunit TatAt [Haloferax gibbonsii ATCC 33959]QOS11331.1 Sec-independent protein translocase protein TatAt [Haloferax gibbonsii]RDZ55117.1 twin-arginine translocase TatA/TatE family subunit [Haloferax sp. Atlit-4N]REA05241.1 twin-arginine translocase TatA/TatE family subunit [Haloferax sp. Atlit-6N]
MFETITPLFPGLPGGPELLVVLLIVVLLFGANKIPKLARSSGQAIGEFQRGREEIEDELQDMKGDDEDEDDATESSADSVETESASTKSSN